MVGLAASAEGAWLGMPRGLRRSTDDRMPACGGRATLLLQALDVCCRRYLELTRWTVSGTQTKVKARGRPICKLRLKLACPNYHMFSGVVQQCKRRQYNSTWRSVSPLPSLTEPKPSTCSDFASQRSSRIRDYSSSSRVCKSCATVYSHDNLLTTYS